MNRVHSDASSVSIPVEGLSALIARLEAAEAGSRELDREIMALTYSWEQRHIGATCWDDRESTCCPGAKHIDWVWVDTATDRWVTNSKTGFDFTASLGRGLALAERLGMDSFRVMYAALMSWKAHDPRGPLSQTLPLALCIATLRAKLDGYAAEGEVNKNPKAQEG